MEKIAFIDPHTKKTVWFDFEQAQSMQSRIDTGDNVGGWVLKNAADREKLNLPALPVEVPQEKSDVVTDKSDKGDTKSAIAEDSHTKGG